MDNKINHLQMIQGVINRMASNSFALKGWAVTLLAGIFALASKEADKMYFLIPYVPIIVFWGLDSYYLLQERLYRKLYKKASSVSDDAKVDFSLSATTEELGKDDKKCTYLNCVMSITELGFYLPLAVLCTVIVLITL